MERNARDRELLIPTSQSVSVKSHVEMTHSFIQLAITKKSYFFQSKNTYILIYIYIYIYIYICIYIERKIYTPVSKNVANLKM